MMTSLPSNVTATGYPKTEDVALVAILVAGGLAGAVVSARLAAAVHRRWNGTGPGRVRLARLERVLRIGLWGASAAYAARAFWT